MAPQGRIVQARVLTSSERHCAQVVDGAVLVLHAARRRVKRVDVLLLPARPVPVRRRRAATALQLQMRDHALILGVSESVSHTRCQSVSRHTLAYVKLYSVNGGREGRIGHLAVPLLYDVRQVMTHIGGHLEQNLGISG